VGCCAAHPLLTYAIQDERPSFPKKRSKKLLSTFGFGLSGEAQTSFPKVFRLFFSK
jgi:hypothetical protein